MGRGVRVRAGWGAVAGRRVKLCRGHLQACTCATALQCCIVQPSGMRRGLQSSVRSHIEFNFWTGTGRPLFYFLVWRKLTRAKNHDATLTRLIPGFSQNCFFFSSNNKISEATRLAEIKHRSHWRVLGDWNTVVSSSKQAEHSESPCFLFLTKCWETLRVAVVAMTQFHTAYQ